MTSLEDLLGDPYQSPEAKLAIELAREDQLLLARLVEIRKGRMTQEQVADLMGVTQATVSAFEKLGNDPKLSTIRRYARAIGVMVRHQLDADPGAGGASKYLSHVGADGVLQTDTAAARAHAVSASEHVRTWPKEAVERAEEREDALA